MLVFLQKAKYCGFGICQETTKVDCMHVAFTNLKISSKKGQKREKAKRKLRMMLFAVTMH